MSCVIGIVSGGPAVVAAVAALALAAAATDGGHGWLRKLEKSTGLSKAWEQKGWSNFYKGRASD